MKGTIVRVVRDRGFGFIKTADGQEIFFHATGVKEATFEELSEGQTVNFDVETDTRTGKQRATNVTPA